MHSCHTVTGSSTNEPPAVFALVFVHRLHLRVALTPVSGG